MDESKYVTNVYNEIAEHFNATRAYNWGWVTEFINSIPKNSKILDIGCGTGRNMLYNDQDFTGIDSSKEFVKICLSKGLDAILGDMCSLPLCRYTFDAIISVASFHHLSSIERRQTALKEMCRVLKPGGTILLSVWSINQPEKTRRKFDKYGDTIVKWTKYNDVYERYYYIFEIPEITKLLSDNKLEILSYKWDCGNEVFILKKLIE